MQKDLVDTDKQLKAARERIKQLEEEKIDFGVALEEEEQLLKQQMDLNKNLLRISRERANSDRKITPKKQHDGFIVIRSTMVTDRYQAHVDFQDWCKTHRYQSKDNYHEYETKEVSVWQTTLQTPYHCSLPAEIVEGMILADFFETVMPSMNIKHIQSENGFYQTWNDDDGTSLNGIYKWRLTANFIAGYWEIAIWTTLPPIVLDSRIPPGSRLEEGE